MNIFLVLGDTLSEFALMIDGGSLTPKDIENGKATDIYQGEQPISTEEVPEAYREPYRSDRPLDTEAIFAHGDSVKAKLVNSDGHTRMPGYVRGHSGTIHRYLGAHIFQDASAHFHGEYPMHLYSVRFKVADLWPKSRESKDAVFVDLWEAHLETHPLKKMIHTAKFGTPFVKQSRAHTMLSAQVWNSGTRLVLLQNADDLLICVL